jgi:hypothetical protein
VGQPSASSPEAVKGDRVGGGVGDDLLLGRALLGEGHDLAGQLDSELLGAVQDVDAVEWTAWMAEDLEQIEHRPLGERATR